jgi:hypothetical protein
MQTFSARKYGSTVKKFGLVMGHRRTQAGCRIPDSYFATLPQKGRDWQKRLLQRLPGVIPANALHAEWAVVIQGYVEELNTHLEKSSRSGDHSPTLGARRSTNEAGSQYLKAIPGSKNILVCCELSVRAWVDKYV